MNLRQPARARDPAIARKAPAQPALPRMARDQTAQTREDNGALERDGAAARRQRLVEELEDRDLGGRVEEQGERGHGEEHGDTV